MVRLHVKKGDESHFLYETTLNKTVEDELSVIVNIYNGRLKITRICYEMEELAKHGVFLPPDMQGLTEEQIEELHLKDEWGEKCKPDNFVVNKDPMGRRNGMRPSDHVADVLNKTRIEALALISKDLIKADACLNMKIIGTALSILGGAVTIAYPMGLPPYDPIRQEIENNEDLSGTQASLEVMDIQRTSLWFCGKELKRDKPLSEYFGKNEKSKAIVKLQTSGQGPPGREPAISAEEHKTLMMLAHRRQEELKRLEEDDDNEYHNSSWADGSELRRAMHGLKDVKFRPK